MMFSDIAIYFNSLPAESKIIILQIFCLTLEVVYFFWLRKFFNEEEEEQKLKLLYKINKV